MIRLYNYIPNRFFESFQIFNITLKIISKYERMSSCHDNQKIARIHFMCQSLQQLKL